MAGKTKYSCSMNNDLLSLSQGSISEYELDSQTREKIKEKTIIYKNALPQGLLDKSGNYTLTQAITIILNTLRDVWNEENNIKKYTALRFKVNPDLSFPPSDIKNIDISTNNIGKMQITITLNLMGLHGAGSPMPTYFTEYIAQNQYTNTSMQDFFDIFNHRLITLLLESTDKYKYFKNYQSGAIDKISSRLFSFMGQGSLAQREESGIHFAKLLPFIGLLSFNGESAQTMEKVLRHYFNYKEIEIIPCIKRWVNITNDQQTLLAKQNSILNDSFILGTSVADINGKFRLRISELSWEQFHEFLPVGKNFQRLIRLMRFLLKSRLAYDIELSLKENEIRIWKLGTNSGYLAWSTWLDNAKTGSVILQPT